MIFAAFKHKYLPVIAVTHLRCDEVSSDLVTANLKPTAYCLV